MNDFIVLGIAYLYVIVVLGIGEVFRKKLNKQPEFTRKIIHIFAGFSVYTVLFFDHPWVANIVAGTFVLLLFLASPSSPVGALREMFGTMEREEEGEKLWGPFYYSVSILTLTLGFTVAGLEQLYWLAATPLTIMYLGDGLAPVIGRRYAKKTFTVFGGSRRSIIGSLTMFIAGFGGAIFAMWFNGIFAIELNYGIPPLLNWDLIIIYSLFAATIATLIEFITPLGLDNLTVPLGTCPLLIIFFLLF
ncbi:MAG: diacylglycerol/polyprenol kinase family protein [Candidatus Helarchaeota archaeon]